MRDLVGKMEVGDCGEEGGEGGYFDGGEGSVVGGVSCIVRGGGERKGEWGCIRGGTVLCFELVGEDEVGGVEEGLVDGDDVWVYVEFALVAHYGVEDCES